jgi:choline dehydrogenase-like flavoprotein
MTVQLSIRIISKRNLTASTFRKASKIAREVGRQPALDEWRDAEALPGLDVQSDAELDAFIAKAASTHHHPAGTCRMASGCSREFRSAAERHRQCPHRRRFGNSTDSERAN